MQLYFTDEELKFVIVTDGSEYSLSSRENTPEEIKKSIMEKIDAHKKWLKSGGRKYDA